MKTVITPGQSRAARGLIGWTQTELATSSGVSEKTIADFERQARTPYARTQEDLKRAFEAAGIEFIAENGGGAGVRMRKASG